MWLKKANLSRKKPKLKRIIAKKINMKTAKAQKRTFQTCGTSIYKLQKKTNAKGRLVLIWWLKDWKTQQMPSSNLSYLALASKSKAPKTKYLSERGFESSLTRDGGKTKKIRKLSVEKLTCTSLLHVKKVYCQSVSYQSLSFYESLANLLKMYSSLVL